MPQMMHYNADTRYYRRPAFGIQQLNRCDGMCSVLLTGEAGVMARSPR